MPSNLLRVLALTSMIFTSLGTASAMDLDWHGQFRAETNWLFGYSNGQYLNNPTHIDQGYSIPNNGNSPASFQNLFFRLDPRAIVNDNITIYSDIWVGGPDTGFFGGDLSSQGNFNSTSTGRSAISMNEFFAEVATDFGTVRVGRAPLNWGLGVVWNNTHADWDRLPSTGDVIGLTTKFGAFKFMPAIVKYRLGSNLGGTFNTATNSTQDGWSGATDYTLGLTYENPDEQLDAGVLFMRRISGVNANLVNPLYGTNTNVTTNPGTGSYAYNLWDFFLKKKVSVFTLAAEVPLVSGQVQGVNYSSVAAAVDARAQLGDHFMIKFDFGQANGQADVNSGQVASNMTVFYFHPDYRPGLIMFNYNLRNFSNPSGGSPYNDPVTNARFFSLGVNYDIGKWDYNLSALTASALQTADGVAGNAYYNTLDGHYYKESGGNAQGSGLGFELDYMMSYQWDDSLKLGLQTGLLFPGSYNKFSNSATDNAQKTIFASLLNMSVKF